MPNYNVLIRVSGLDIHSAKGDPANGFYTNRVARAIDANAAADLAIARLKVEPKVVELLEKSSGLKSANFAADEVTEISLLRSFFSSRTGLIFYKD